MHSYVKEIQERVMKYRIRHDLSMEQFSDMVGVSRPTLSKIENGVPVFRTTHLKVEHWLNRHEDEDGTRGKELYE